MTIYANLSTRPIPKLYPILFITLIYLLILTSVPYLKCVLYRSSIVNILAYKYTLLFYGRVYL